MYSYIHIVLYVDIADACGGPYYTCLVYPRDFSRPLTYTGVQ